MRCLQAAVHGPHVAFVVTPPPQNVSVARPEPRKSRSWRNLAAISVSGAIIGLTGQVFLYHGAGTGRVGTRQSTPSDVVEGNRASRKQAPQVSTALTQRQPEAERVLAKGASNLHRRLCTTRLFCQKQNHGSVPAPEAGAMLMMSHLLPLPVECPNSPAELSDLPTRSRSKQVIVDDATISFHLGPRVARGELH